MPVQNSAHLTLRLNSLKSEGVPYNGHRTKAHGGGSDDGAEQDADNGIKNPSRYGNSNRVVHKCEDEVLLDDALAEPFGIHFLLVFGACTSCMDTQGIC